MYVNLVGGSNKITLHVVIVAQSAPGHEPPLNIGWAKSYPVLGKQYPDSFPRIFLSITSVLSMSEWL